MINGKTNNGELLVLITSNYPFGSGESFVDSELQILSIRFEEILIIAQNFRSTQTRTVPGNVKILRYNPATSLMGFLLLPLTLFLSGKDFISIIRDELRFRASINYKLTFFNFCFLIRKTIKAIQLKNFIKNRIKHYDPSCRIILYSYWLNSGAHAASIIKRENTIRIARAHGSDLYEEKSPNRFLPMLHHCGLNLDGLFFISNNGKVYFERKTGLKKENFYLSRLGISTNVKPGEKIETEKSVTIISCSNLIPLKRVSLIIDSLAETRTDKTISWIHFGDGPLKKELEEYAFAKLGNNPSVSYKFSGQISNEELLKFYAENRPDFFINLSSTEGVPVSIMEAQLYSMIVIATDVGGVSELVNKDTGILISPQSSAKEIGAVISNLLILNPDQRQILSDNARKQVLADFNATHNYESFANTLNTIFEEDKTYL